MNFVLYSSTGTIIYVSTRSSMEDQCMSIENQPSHKLGIIYKKKGAHRDKLQDFVNNDHRRAYHQHCFPLKPVERGDGKQFL